MRRDERPKNSLVNYEIATIIGVLKRVKTNKTTQRPSEIFEQQKYSKKIKKY